MRLFNAIALTILSEFEKKVRLSENVLEMFWKSFESVPEMV
jgi:hypothetical protein